MEGTGGDRGVTGKLTGQQLIMGTKSVRSWFAQSPCNFATSQTMQNQDLTNTMSQCTTNFLKHYIDSTTGSIQVIVSFCVLPPNDRLLLNTLFVVKLNLDSVIVERVSRCVCNFRRNLQPQSVSHPIINKTYNHYPIHHCIIIYSG